MFKTTVATVNVVCLQGNTQTKVKNWRHITAVLCFSDVLAYLKCSVKVVINSYT